MIADIKYKGNVSPVIEYHFKKIEEGKAYFINSNLAYSDKKELIDLYNLQASLNEKVTKNKFLHISMSPNPKDILDDKKIEDVALKYLQSMGLEDRPYFIVKHIDTHNSHFHIVTTSVDDNGKAYQQRQDYVKNLKTCRELEKEFNLIVTEQKKNWKELSFAERQSQLHSVGNSFKIKDTVSIANDTNINILKLLEIKRQSMDNAHIINYLSSEEYSKLQGYLIHKGRVEANPKEQTIIKLKSALAHSNDTQTFIKEAEKSNIKVRLIQNKDRFYYGYKDETTGNYYESKHLGPEFMLENMFKDKPSLPYFNHKVQTHLLEAMKTCTSVKELNQILAHNNIVLKLKGDDLMFSHTKYSDISIPTDNLFTNTFKKSENISKDYIENRIKSNVEFVLKSEQFKDKQNTKQQTLPNDFSLSQALSNQSNAGHSDEILDNDQKKRKRKFDNDLDKDL